MKKLYYAVVLIGASLCCVGMQAKVQKIKSDNKFNRVIDKEAFVAALFYEDGAAYRDDERYQDGIKQLRDSFSSLSDKKFYKKGGVRFVEVKNPGDLADHYDLKKLPAVILFKDGLRVQDNNKPVVLIGFARRVILRDFIDNYFAGDIEATLDEKAEERELRREEGREARASVYMGYGSYGYYDPWWGGYPYGRRYYGPGFSFGFGI